jgi:hypothetical protein
VSAGEGIDEVVEGDGAEDDGLGEDVAAATVVWLLKCDIRSSLDENLRPQKSVPLIQLQTNGEAPPIEAVAVDEVAEELLAVVVDGVEWWGMLGGDCNPNIAAVVTGG